ncbi:polysaccharide pyruvyl transferase family protein [Flavobacterium sp.]|uniref:polysaccharide pyruvyl transferase family protein n=1 Tax=Flavobacterium sp. TaxID=239 RepID=UPI003340BE31
MKILMFNHTGSDNRGCEAIVRSSCQLLSERFQAGEIGLASFKPETDVLFENMVRIHDVRRNKVSKYSLPWIKSALSVKLFKDETPMLRYQNAPLLNLIPQYDVFLSIGGDNYCYGEQPWLYLINHEIKKVGKKLILWGASIGQEDLSLAKVSDLKQFDLLLVRETLTYDVLKRNGITRVQLCADGAFTMEQEQLPLPEGWQEGNTIGFNTSPLVIRKNPASKQAALDLVQHILDTTDMTIAFTPHVIEPGNDDYECLAEFYEIFKGSGRVLLLPNHLNAIQYKGYIARMRFFIGARTHATIAAYSTLVPTMVLGYSVKSKGIAKDIFGEERLVLNLAEISDSAKLIDKFEEMKRDESDLRTLLATRIPEIKKMSQKAVDYLFELLKK